MSDGSYLRALREVAQQGDIPVFNATTARFEVGSAPLGSGSQIFVNSVTGSDTNSGSSGSPVQSFDEAITRAVARAKLGFATDVLLQAGGTYGATQVIGAGETLQAPIWVRPDESNPAVYTTTLQQVSQAGTGAAAIVGAGLTGDALRGFGIEFLDGAAVGQRRFIRDNDATTITPVVAFSPAPAPGDTFRVFRPALQLDLSAIANGPLGRLNGPVQLGDYSGATLPGALAFGGLNLNGGGSLRVSNFSLAIYGCEGTTEFQGMGGSVLAGADSYILPFNLASATLPTVLGVVEDAWSGWAYRRIGGRAVNGFGGGAILLNGVVTDAAVRVWTSFVALLAGYYECNATNSVCVSLSFNATGIIAAGAAGAVPPRLNRTAVAGAFDVALYLSQSDLTLGFAANYQAQIDSAAAGMLFSSGSRVLMTAPDIIGTPTTTAVRCSGGGSVRLIGAPVYGDAVALDWDVGNGAPVNKSAFAASPSSLVFYTGANADGSAISR